MMHLIPERIFTSSGSLDDTTAECGAAPREWRHAHLDDRGLGQGAESAEGDRPLDPWEARRTAN
jgi:hypothetical protein